MTEVKSGGCDGREERGMLEGGSSFRAALYERRTWVSRATLSQEAAVSGQCNCERAPPLRVAYSVFKKVLSNRVLENDML